MTETKILRLPEVIDRVALRKTAIYAAIKRGDFPQPVRLSKRAVGWRLADIERWAANRPAGATGETAPAA